MRQCAKKGLGRVCLVLALLLGLVGCGFSYEEMDPQEYITLSFSSLDALTVVLDSAYEVTEEDVKQGVHDLLLGLKTAKNGGTEETDIPVGDGDVVAFYYMLVLEDGTVYTDGFDVGATPYLLEVGAKRFPVMGVEEALMGVVPSQHKVISSGVVEDTSLVYLEYYYEDYVDGEKTGTPVSVPLSRVEMEGADTLFGQGFIEGLVGAELGRFVTLTTTDEGGTPQREYRVRPRYIGRGELQVETTHPETGEAATAYLQTAYMVDYDVPPLTSDTVTQKLGLHQDAPDPVAALEAQVKEELLLKEARQAAFRREALKVLVEQVTYQTLPKQKVKDIAGGLKTELEELYEYSRENLYDYCVETFGGDSMETLDGFARAMYSGKAGDTAESLLCAEAEEQVKLDLLVYALAKTYDLFPSEEELTAGTQAIIDTYLAGTDTTEKQLLKMWGGREYFEAQYCDAYVFMKLSQKVTIVYR